MQLGYDIVYYDAALLVVLGVRSNWSVLQRQREKPRGHCISSQLGYIIVALDK